MRRLAPATHWPEADALFRSDPRWLGSDDAYSIELSPGRVLWLFGDTFVGDGTDPRRAHAKFVHNSIGIQHGADPSVASMTFAWRPGPRAFFQARAGEWYWPLHGAVIDGSLLLFVMRIRSAIGGTGAIGEWRRLGALMFFKVFGWAALRVPNPHDDPSEWLVERVAEHAGPVVLGTSVVAEGDFLYVFGSVPKRRVLLARWPAGDVLRAGPEWWTGSGWSRSAGPEPVVERAATEFTVHRDARSGAWCQTQMVARRGPLGIRRSDRLEGPWSEPEPVFVPEESARDPIFLYAGKAHPHLTGADLVLTYASVAEAELTLSDDSIYRPRFVAVNAEQP